ncbi:MAG TPA: nicotinate-nucleotide--dimethylbenzimidazole phosphoribosyltransferase [Firmicutes bacterium]|nr:nicotinate-nucleotide--dimethylbenzimidazole phosphoribosyltransferase [Bacillota bacterium]
MKIIKETIFRIKPLNQKAMERARQRQDLLTKPSGSLGRLEELSVQLAGIRGDFFPPDSKKVIVAMAADHGVTAEGVSAFPREVTAQMVLNFVNNGAGVNVLARLSGAEVKVVDIGVDSEIDSPLVKKAKIRYGTANMCEEKAMSREEACRAVAVGISTAEEESEAGALVLATGEMGIGNSTASSAVAAALTGRPPSMLAGRGTGLDDQGLKRKIEVLERALALHRPEPEDPLDVLSKVGGLELGGLAGLILGAAACRRPVIIDGFISTAAALLAVSLCPTAKSYLIPSHLSREPGHGFLLSFMHLQPYLHLNMCLGEGTGAALAMNLVEAASRIMLEMATFEGAGISNKQQGIKV